MLKEKSARLFRRFKRNLRSILLLWFPAGIVVAFFAYILFSVAFSKDASFYSCTKFFMQCSEKNPDLIHVTKCSYQTAWCDVKVIWDKLNGKSFPDLPGLPVADEKAEKELFEKMISDEFIEQRFKEFQKEEEGRLQTQTPSKEELERYMLQMRKERIEFEKEQAAKREAIAREKKMGTEQKNDSSENDNLTGKSEI